MRHVEVIKVTMKAIMLPPLEVFISTSFLDLKSLLQYVTGARTVLGNSIMVSFSSEDADAGITEYLWQRITALNSD